MTRETWQIYLRQVGTLGLALLAWQGVQYYLGSDPTPLREVAMLYVGMAALIWLMLRKNPNLYDRRRTNREAS